MKDGVRRVAHARRSQRPLEVRRRRRGGASPLVFGLVLVVLFVGAAFAVGWLVGHTLL